MHVYLIVIFNEKVYNTVTYKTLDTVLSTTLHDSKIIIWDNSPQAQHTEEELINYINFDFEYYHSKSNESLSALYNKLIDKEFKGEADYFTILDQDSSLSANFKASMASVDKSKLLLPIVCSDKSGKVISPRYQRYNYFLNKCSIDYISLQCKQQSTYPSKDFFAVGSGMTITKNVWATGIKFREELSFYGVDTEFCVDYSKMISSFILLDTKVSHNASNEHDEGYEKFKWRLKKYYEHWRYQLVAHTQMPKGVSAVYVHYFFYYALLKNRIKRLLKH